MMKNWLAAGAVALTAALTTTAMTSTAQAASVTQPGEQVGLAFGPLPEGVYAINTFSVGRSDAPNSPDVGVNVPILVYASPYKIFGAQIIPVAAVPSVFVGTNPPGGLGAQDQSYLYNPFVGSIFAWDLGGNVSAAYLVGAYLNFGARGSLCNGVLPPGSGCTPVLPQLASNSVRNEAAISYTGNGYNLTAALTHILVVDDQARFGGQVGAALGPIGNADGLYIDLTATKKFDLFNEGKPKFEFGAVAFGYTDLPVNRNKLGYANYVKEGEFAVGGLVGYDFGLFTAQLFVTRQVAQRAQYVTTGGRVEDNLETRGWFRIIAPLYTAPAAPPPAPIVRKY